MTSSGQTPIMKNQVYLFVFLGLLSLASCGTSNQLFQDVPEIDLGLASRQTSSESLTEIKAGDKVSISIWGHENLSVGSVNSPFNSSESTGRWVEIDQDGYVNLPKVGRVILKGATPTEAAYLLEEAYKLHLRNPVVHVKVHGHQFSVLGEVESPGNYSIRSAEISLLEALAEGGGLTEDANTEEIQIIREINGSPVKMELNLAANAMAAHPFGVRSEDVIYIPPRQSKQIGKKAAKAAPFVGIITGAAVLIGTLTRK